MRVRGSVFVPAFVRTAAVLDFRVAGLFAERAGKAAVFPAKIAIKSTAGRPRIRDLERMAIKSTAGRPRIRDLLRMPATAHASALVRLL